MPRSKKKPTSKAPPAESAASPVEPVQPASPPSRDVLIGVAVVVFLWVTGLAVIAFVSRDRLLVNRMQVQQSTRIVTAKVIDTAAGIVTVRKIWKPAGLDAPQGKDEEFVIRNLREVRATDGEVYVIPLTRTIDNAWEITRPTFRVDQRNNEESSHPPRIYPANESTIGQLAEMLGN